MADSWRILSHCGAERQKRASKEDEGDEGGRMGGWGVEEEGGEGVRWLI